MSARATASLAVASIALISSGTAPAARADEPLAEAVLAELPFLESVEVNEVWIDLAPPGGRALGLRLDTGAAQTFATPGAARELGLSVRRNKQTPYRRDTLLGRDLQIFVDTRRSELSGRGGHEFALVGGDFLAEYVVEIDFPARRVRFLDAGRYRVPERAEGAAVTLPMRLLTNRPVIEIRVGSVTVPAVVSTGAPGTLILPGGWARDTSLRPDPEETARLELPDHLGDIEAAVAERVRIGPFEEVEVPLLVAPRGLHNQGPRSEAILGVDLLRRFVVRIDYPRRRLWIAAGSASPEQAPSGGS